MKKDFCCGCCLPVPECTAVGSAQRHLGCVSGGVGRLGYTYDWSGGDSPYGFTEFLIADESDTEIAFTYSIEDFVNWLDSQS